MKRFIAVFLLSISLIMPLSACGKDGKGENIKHGGTAVSSEVNIENMSVKELISGYAFEAGTDEDGTLEAYIFFADGKLYYFGKSAKIGTWSVNGDKLTTDYTSSDGVKTDESCVISISVESEIGIMIGGTEFMMIDTAENYIS